MFIYVPGNTAVMSPKGIVAQVLSLVKNLDADVEVPSTADKSTVYALFIDVPPFVKLTNVPFAKSV